MTIELITIGKTDSAPVAELVSDYLKRINRYLKFSITTIPDIRNVRSLSQAEQKIREGECILKMLADSDHVVLLDERGVTMRSVGFAEWLNKKMTSGIRRLVFVIGGPYGFSGEIYRRADYKISLSPMTFSHQIVRAVFAEQLYRGLSILKNEPYHHE